jgi:hypothetical protein
VPRFGPRPSWRATTLVGSKLFDIDAELPVQALPKKRKPPPTEAASPVSHSPRSLHAVCAHRMSQAIWRRL